MQDTFNGTAFHDTQVAQMIRLAVRSLHKKQMGVAEYLAVAPAWDDPLKFEVTLARWNDKKGDEARYDRTGFTVTMQEIWQAQDNGSRWLHNLLKPKIAEALKGWKSQGDVKVKRKPELAGVN